MDDYLYGYFNFVLLVVLEKFSGLIKFFNILGDLVILIWFLFKKDGGVLI